MSKGDLIQILACFLDVISLFSSNFILSQRVEIISVLSNQSNLLVEIIRTHHHIKLLITVMMTPAFQDHTTVG